MIRTAFQKLMYGRYGSDQLNLFLVGLYLTLYLVSVLVGWRILYALNCILVCLALFRCLSRNFPKRREENAKFMKLIQPIVSWFRLRRTMHRDKEHCYFRCPSCGQQLRVPKGKGKITVTCRGCGASFQEKS